MMSNPSILSFSAFVAALCVPATAQIPGDSYLATPGIGGAGGFAFSMNGAVESTIDSMSEVVGMTLATATTMPANVDSVDTIVSNGSGNFVLTLRVSSTEDLAPAGFGVGGMAADTAGFFMGAAGGGSPVNFTRAAIVNSATIALLDVAGAPLAAPFDITTFANFANPAFGGGWDGSLGVTFGAGSVGGIFGYELVVDYNEGAILGTFETSGMGCPAAMPVNLSTDALPAINASFTITAADLPAGSTAASLLFGFAPSANLPLDILGATGCSLLVNNIFTNSMMTVSGSDATFTIVVPNDPASVGLGLDVQSAVIAPGANALNIVLSDLATFTVGG